MVSLNHGDLRGSSQTGQGGGFVLANVTLYWPIRHRYDMNIVHTPNHYLIILDGVPHGKLTPLHLPSFSAFIRPLQQ